MSIATVPLVVGAVIAVAVVLFARLSGFDRGQVFYPTILIVTASYYMLFAVIYGDGSELTAEAFVMAIFVALAVIGFRTSLWVVVVGFVAHGLFDVCRHWWLAGRGVPSSWPAFCLAFDIVAAAGMAVLLLAGRNRRMGERG
jgi:hypothetical protein